MHKVLAAQVGCLGSLNHQEYMGRPQGFPKNVPDLSGFLPPHAVTVGVHSKVSIGPFIIFA